MGKFWVQLKTPKIVFEGGTGTHYLAGDWVETGKMQAKQWLADGSAEVPRSDIKKEIIADLDNCGIVVYRGDAGQVSSHVHSHFPGLSVVGGDLRLEFPQTLLYDSACPLRLDLSVVGFHRLTTGWQIAAPLWNYQQLARDVGNEGERACTKSVIHDLRVPIYDTRLVYVRRCPQTTSFLELWKSERQSGDDKLAFMRALYQSRLVICALPTTWKGRRAR